MTATQEHLRRVQGEAQGRGMVIYRASRLEALLEPLRALMAATAPRNPLAPQTLIAAHPGIKQWLNGALARAAGPDGIAANLDILLPSSWIDRLAQQRLGRQAVALPRYRRPQLRWAIHALLEGDLAAAGVSDARVAAYLADLGDDGDDSAPGGGAADAARRRFQLADRLAGLYSQYLVYRPDWLQAWERGNHSAAARGSGDALAAATERELLAPLWRRLQKRLGAHRGDVVQALIAQLQTDIGETGDETLHVFGTSHLAPSELAVLRAWSTRRLVALYVPDPCRQYWGGLGDTLARLRSERAQELARIAEHGDDYWVEQGHPLLASWGRMGQHFMLALAGAEGDGDVLEDVRHWQDLQAGKPADRLARVQQSIRALDFGLMEHPLASDDAAERADASLRVHACHTRLRELEVLRDQLLDALASADADGQPIRPSDIVVMAPNIQAYVPLIPSVFGAPGDGRNPLPYHLADIAVASSHPLFGAFRRLLDLPAARISAPEVVDLLAVPEIARRLGLDAAGIEELADWLRRSRVAWALDGPFRQRFGVPPIAEHGFGWAMDRLLAGYLMADAADDDRQAPVHLADGSALAPLTGIDGPAAEQLGALDQLLGELQRLCSLADQRLPASEWAAQLERSVEALFRIDPTDAAAREAHAMLLRFVRALASEPAGAGEDPTLHYAVVRDLLVERIESAPERQRFLMGGITFCGMVPQRAIPFKVVAVLGLDDGAFPRATSDSGLDLMARFRRLGDRDVRSDDRYLFLETLMSARARLHLSHVGEGVHDGKARNPAAPLAELLAALDLAAGLDPDDGEIDRPWRVKHPLQPFDARYFDGADPRLFSHEARFAAMRGDGRDAAVPPFLDLRQVRPVAIDPPIPLREVKAWYKNPAQQLLRGRMHVRLDALDDDRLPQEEPLDAKLPPMATVAKRVFFEALANGTAELDLTKPPEWLRLGGLLAPGAPGLKAWTDECTVANAMLEQARKLPGLGATPIQANHDIDLLLDGRRLTGQVEQVYPAHDGAQWLVMRTVSGRKGKLKKEADVDFRYRLPMFLDWALLRLQSARAGGTLPAVRLHVLLHGGTPWQDGINGWDGVLLQAGAAARTTLLGDLEQRIVRLLDWWIEAQGTPKWYFPKTAWYSIAPGVNGEPKPDAAADAWAGGDHSRGERDYAPGYARLLAGDADFGLGSDELIALRTFAAELQDCIRLQPPRLEAVA
ncbi:MAG TPA: exodeoxyribonuclease V subunit gamma [Rhodanobacteraceae bacterium]|nr:exodeoxyribonuclease V subunit gamma [Rhodanobacteraceae bacterium]